MSKKGDENRDEEILDEEDTDAAEAEDTDSDSDAEDEEESQDDSEDESDEDESEDESDDQEEEEDDQKGKQKGKFVMPEKFKGKSAEEIAKAYQNLEGMVGQKALEMAQDFLTKKGIKATDEDKGDDEDEFDLGLTDEEIAKMTPKEFARHLNRKITEKATEIARNAIDRSNEVKNNVSREIREATKAHPHLKENKEYREIVLSIIEAANAKGKIVTLKEACQKADKAMGIKPGAKKEDEGQQKKKRPAVEKQDGSDGKAPKSDDDRVREGILNAGQSTGFLGGLGV